MVEQEKRPSLSELVGNADSTKKLGVLATRVLIGIPEFVSKAGVAAYFGNRWAGFEKDGFQFLVRFEIIKNVETSEVNKVLRIDRKSSDETVESVQFIYQDGKDEKGFSGLSYVTGKETVEMVYEEEGAYRSEFDEPVLGDEAAPKAKEIIKSLI